MSSSHVSSARGTRRPVTRRRCDHKGVCDSRGRPPSPSPRPRRPAPGPTTLAHDANAPAGADLGQETGTARSARSGHLTPNLLGSSLASGQGCGTARAAAPLNHHPDNLEVRALALTVVERPALRSACQAAAEPIDRPAAQELTCDPTDANSSGAWCHRTRPDRTYYRQRTAPRRCGRLEALGGRDGQAVAHPGRGSTGTGRGAVEGLRAARQRALASVRIGSCQRVPADALQSFLVELRRGERTPRHSPVRLRPTRRSAVPSARAGHHGQAHRVRRVVDLQGRGGLLARLRLDGTQGARQARPPARLRRPPRRRRGEGASARGQARAGTAGAAG